VNVIITTLY